MLDALLAAVVVAQQAIVIHGVTIIDGTGAPARSAQTIVIEGKRIAAIGPDGSVVAPPGARMIAGRSKFLFLGSSTRMPMWPLAR
jgi:imidazolonepropionase-like amidohydrolase